ncbi:MAG: outer membrane protein assembly factor BamB family protein, partial [Candidatus Thorarchaeota archaeon]
MTRFVIVSVIIFLLIPMTSPFDYSNPITQTFQDTEIMNEVLPTLWSYSLEHYRAEDPLVADLDGDSSPEVVAAISSTQDQHLIVLDAESGGLKWSYDLEGAYATTPVLADVNNDSVIDILVGTSYYRGGFITTLDGFTGQLIWRVEIPIVEPSTLAIGDTDEDTGLELVIRGDRADALVLDAYDGSVIWYFTIDGSYTPNPELLLVDITGNGKQDVVFWSWREKTIYILNGQTGDVLYTFQNYRVSHPMVAADLDSDGNNEIIISDFFNGLRVLHPETGQFLWERTEGRGFYYGYGISLGDVNGDSMIDVIFTTRSTVIALDGISGDLHWRRRTAGYMANAASIGDCTGDGKLEIVQCTSGGTVYILNGETGDTIIQRTMDYGTYRNPYLWDIDQDGGLELIIATGQNSIVALDTQGDGKRIFWQAKGGSINCRMAYSLENVDSDFDTLSDFSEEIYQTDVMQHDSDLDSMPDGYEAYHNLDPLSNDTMGDPDEDSLVNIEEFNIGTSPSNDDTDR